MQCVGTNINSSSFTPATSFDLLYNTLFLSLYVNVLKSTNLSYKTTKAVRSVIVFMCDPVTHREKTPLHCAQTNLWMWIQNGRTIVFRLILHFNKITKWQLYIFKYYKF